MWTIQGIHVLYHLQQNFNLKFLNRKIKKNTNREKTNKPKKNKKKKKKSTTFNGAAAVKLFCFGKTMRNSFAKDVCEGNVY